MKATTASALALFAMLQASLVLAQTSLYIPGFDPQPITADVEGVDAQGRTTWRLGPGVTSGTYEDPAGIEGSATLVADATEAHFIWANTELSMTLSEDCSISGSTAVCSGFADVEGTGQSLFATETVSPFEVQGNAAAPTATAPAGGSSGASSGSGAASNTSAGSSAPTAGSGVSSGPSATGASTSASPTATTQNNGVKRRESSALPALLAVFAPPPASPSTRSHLFSLLVAEARDLPYTRMPAELADNGLANHVLPRRAAARKASKLAAEQLESSPDSSDAENDGAVTFGEPSTPKSGVKVTYGGKRTSRTSPTKSSPAYHTGSSRAHPRSISLIEESPGKTKRGTAQGRGASRGRGGRKRQSTSKKSLALTLEAQGDDSSGLEIIDVHADTGHASVSAHLAKSRPATTAVKSAHAYRTSAAGEGGSRKRPLSLSSSEGERSSLSSPDAQRVPEARPMPVLAPRLARQFMRSQSHAHTSTASAKKNLLKHSKSFDHLFVLDSSDDESADELDPGDLVWVSIDLHGRLTNVNESGDDDTLWWPAKVDLPKPCMRVSLFGEPPGLAAAGISQLDIPSPSPLNVRSLQHNGRIRFSETDYRSAPRQSVQSSPRKRRKLDVDTAWEEARDLMLAAAASENPGNGSSRAGARTASGKHIVKPFPSLESDTQKGKSKINGKGKWGKGKGKGTGLSSDLDEKGDPSNFQVARKRAWRAPSANPLLEIPGELVLARDSKRQDHWPAKVLEYIKPQHSRQRPKYKVLFFDGTIMAIDPNMFWTTTDDEFATCRLGESKDNYGLDSDVDAIDEEDIMEEFTRPGAPDGDEELRAPSPLPSLPPPAPEAFEYDLSISEQFEYVKPVLAAIIDGRYGPALQRHEGFMRGAGARRKVLDSVPLRGSLSAREKEEVAYLVRSWARRRERRREMGLSTEYPQDKLYPPEGDTPDEANGHDDDDADSVLTPASDTSGGDTEPLALFDAEPPPSSFAATEADTDDDDQLQISTSDAPTHDEDHPVEPQGNAEESLTCLSTSFADSEALPSQCIVTATDTGAHGDVVVDDAPHIVSRTFHDLDPVEKITYCDNVLLQEAILQLLLWRTGQRKTLGLLSAQEEQRLHDIAVEEGEKTYWVHDILRMRQAVEKTMLPTAKGKEKAGEPLPGVRARTRRGA
ncbi:hypothetical protein BN946_scf185014.g123 [Trametes cinnabarina]|uniref:PWWP domain-containing protein n=1 Tax=Pycnoporus cinnabarinus TaxID=5643 RepID=A0A060SMK3_PYCCI|nr:hypothetical protein BN946_scf185014.g123 [Trametes cinnabarina]